MVSSTQRPLADPAAGAALLLIRLGLIVLAFGVPMSVVVSRRALFTLLPVGIGLLFVATTLLPRPPFAHRLRAFFLAPAGLAALALFAWIALSIVWTPFPADASQRWLKEVGTLLLVVLVAALLPERTRTSNLYLFPLGLAAAALATFAVSLVDPRTFGTFQDADSTLERAVISLVMLAWPALGALAVRDRWISTILLAVGVALAAMAAWTSIALAALALGAIVFSVATFGPERAGRVLGIIVGVAILLAPALPLAFAPAAAGLAERLSDKLAMLGDAAQSLHVWADLVTREPVRLITGHGFDMATRATYSGYLPADTPRSLLFVIWYELGLVGAVAAAVLAVGGIAAAGRTSPTVAPFLLAEIMTCLVLGFWGLDTTQLWWMTIIGVAGVAFANVNRGQYRTDRPPAYFDGNVDLQDRFSAQAQ